MLGINQIRRRRLWLICASATIFLVVCFYLSTGREPRETSISQQPAIVSPSSKEFVLSPSKSSDPTPPPQNTAYTRTLVIAKLQEEDASWVDAIVNELPQLTSAVYTVDNPNTTLTVPANKGHEAMVYLTYIIDHYSQLSDITIFMHSHRITWHNNDFLKSDSAAMVKLLKNEHVIRSGYMNLRCHWEPGCPDHIHPSAGSITNDITNIPEAAVLAKSWEMLFPNAAVPEVLSQPCCGQFAVSAKHIRRVSLNEYISYRDWLLETPLEDMVSGRVWEYIWQWLFTGQPEFCPEETYCYCEGYGVCFDPSDYRDYFKMRDQTAGILAEIDRLRSANNTADIPEGRILAMDAEVQRLHQKMDEIKHSGLKDVVL
ncbi:hypothetical protein PHISP_06906 [Aspergillus sp. HF37]|nr:hypothetical protein PHISP_06906 [Aspergillus sp. HF37]